MTLRVILRIDFRQPHWAVAWLPDAQAVHPYTLFYAVRIGESEGLYEVCARYSRVASVRESLSLSEAVECFYGCVVHLCHRMPTNACRWAK